MLPKLGDPAPDFELTGVLRDHRQKFRLNDYQGKKHVLLAFYAVDFSPA